MTSPWSVGSLLGAALLLLLLLLLRGESVALAQGAPAPADPMDGANDALKTCLQRH